MNRIDVFYTVWHILENATYQKGILDDDTREAIAAAIIYAAVELSDKYYNVEDVLPEVWADALEQAERD